MSTETKAATDADEERAQEASAAAQAGWAGHELAAHPSAFLGTLLLIPPPDGREQPVWSGWHCQLRLPNGIADGMIVVEGRESLLPGQAGSVKLFLSLPDEAEPEWLEPETILEVLEQGRLVGRLQIFEPVEG